MASVWKDNKGVYQIEYTDATGKRRRRKGYRDKRSSIELSFKLEDRAQRIRDGLFDEKEEMTRRHELSPIKIHADEFRVYLSDKGNTSKHVRLESERIRTMIRLAKVDRLCDVTLSKVMRALACVETNGRAVSIQTKNHYIRAIKHFLNWAVEDNRLRMNPVAHLKTSNPEPDRRLVRRALTNDELRRLVTLTAKSDRVFQYMTGVDRAILYRTASETGLRAKELGSLTDESLSVDPPALTVLAKNSKRRLLDRQPIRPALAKALKDWLGTRKGPLWPGKWPLRAYVMIRRDCEIAGIPIKTTEGVIDFHALRATFATNIVAVTDPKTAQELLRHSSAVMTIGLYAKRKTERVTAALDGLPDIGASNPKREVSASIAVLPMRYSGSPKGALNLLPVAKPQARR